MINRLAKAAETKRDLLGSMPISVIKLADCWRRVGSVHFPPSRRFLLAHDFAGAPKQQVYSSRDCYQLYDFWLVLWWESVDSTSGHPWLQTRSSLSSCLLQQPQTKAFKAPKNQEERNVTLL